MKSFNIVFLIFLAVMVILPALFLMKIPPKDITIKDLASSAPLQYSEKPNYFEDSYHEPFSDSTLNQSEYYVIAGSFKNPVQAGQRAVELRNMTIKEIIILNPTS